jgi:hypothetical protein
VDDGEICKKSLIIFFVKLQNCKKSQKNHKILKNNSKYSAPMFWTVIQPTVHGENCHFAKMNNADHEFVVQQKAS